MEVSIHMKACEQYHHHQISYIVNRHYVYVHVCSWGFILKECKYELIELARRVVDDRKLQRKSIYAELENEENKNQMVCCSTVAILIGDTRGVIWKKSKIEWERFQW